MIRAVLLSTCFALAAGDTLGAFNISIDGVPSRMYAVSQTWQGQFFSASADGGQVALNGGGRFYVANTRMPTPGALVADSYWQAPLLGRELSYTVDLSGVGCSCNAALYFVSMPGHNKTSGAAPDATKGGDYYCGANAGKTPGNNYCPEMDALRMRLCSEIKVVIAAIGTSPPVANASANNWTPAPGPIAYNELWRWPWRTNPGSL